jgi:hypothetical protein
MGIRTTTTTKGRSITFNMGDKHYYTPGADKSIVFDGLFKDHKFCVCYTKVCSDSGYRTEMRWGSPELVHYDNGNIGYQCFNYFNDRKEAEDDFEGRKKLTPKDFTKTFAYCDVFLVENN